MTVFLFCALLVAWAIRPDMRLKWWIFTLALAWAVSFDVLFFGMLIRQLVR